MTVVHQKHVTEIFIFQMRILDCLRESEVVSYDRFSIEALYVTVMKQTCNDKLFYS